jgi:hypothetical protein
MDIPIKSERICEYRFGAAKIGECHQNRKGKESIFKCDRICFAKFLNGWNNLCKIDRYCDKFMRLIVL